MSNEFKRYADDWTDLFDWMQVHPNTRHTIRTDTESEAKALRLMFYKARKAAMTQHGVNFVSIWGNLMLRVLYVHDGDLVFEVAGCGHTASKIKNSMKGLSHESEARKPDPDAD